MQPMLNIAIRAARLAGNAISSSLENKKSIEVKQKGKNDFVTNIDLYCEELIIETIKKAYPDHSFTGEETGVHNGSNTEYRWIIDPLDGTFNFIRDIPHFSVSIALQVRGRTEIGVVYDPLKNELFSSIRGTGSKLNDQRIRISSVPQLTSALISIGSRKDSNNYSEKIIYESYDIRRLGSAALDLCYVASGRTDGYIENGLKPWDIAAGELIAREAGAICTDFNGSTQYLKTGNIVCSNVKLLREILKNLA